MRAAKNWKEKTKNNDEDKPLENMLVDVKPPPDPKYKEIILKLDSSLENINLDIS